MFLQTHTSTSLPNVSMGFWPWFWRFCLGKSGSASSNLSSLATPPTAMVMGFIKGDIFLMLPWALLRGRFMLTLVIFKSTPTLDNG
jgi:hypothetical protein